MKPGSQFTKPKVGQYVQMHVDGKFVNGTSVYSTYKYGKALQFKIGSGQAFKCWDEVGLNMNRG